MALVVMCGQPCSGKSTAASLVAGILRSQHLNVKLIDESCLHLDRNVAYAEVDECRKWNMERGDRGEVTYSDKVLDDLIRRFEKPDSHNRWDYPLFELFPSKDGIKESSAAVTDAVSYLTTKSTTKSGDVLVLQPTIATRNERISDANSLFEMDQATQEVINTIVEAQSSGLGGPLNKINIGHRLPTRPVGLPELRRLRKTFIKLTAQTSLSGPPPPSDADSVKRMFADYLNKEIGAA
ncbi:unnamed protein product [Victoria cruziana]